jgi:hypothetical protein
VSESFNPYVEWLGFTGGQRPADHYELLGIDRFQNDPAAIGHAADVLTSRIRRVRPGQYLAAWQDLLDQLRLAKTCLLDPASKAAYDASLRGPAQPLPVEPAYSAPPMAQPPSGPVMALPPASAWGTPQPSSSPVSPGGQAGPQVEPVAGPYAPSAGVAAGPNTVPGGDPGWTPPTSPAGPAWNTPAAMPGASPGQGWNPAGPQPGPPTPSTPGPYPYPAQQPYAYPAQQPYPYPPQQPYPIPAQQPNPYPPQQPYPIPAQQPNPYPPQQPYPIPAQQPYPYPAQQPNPYPPQQPYPEPNAWTNSPGAGGYLPAGASPLPGQPAGQPQGYYPATGPTPATPSWPQAGQTVPAQGWGYSPTVPPLLAPGLPPIAAVAGAYAPPAGSAAPPLEASPAAAGASFIDDSLMHGIQPSTKLSRTPARQKSSLVRTLLNLMFLAAIAVAVILAYKHYQKNLKGSRTIKTGLPASVAPEVTPPPPPPPGTRQAKPPRTDSKKPEEKKPDAKPGPLVQAKEPDKPKPDADKKPDGPGDPVKQKSFKQALAAARIALSQRDADGLKRYLALADQNAQGPNDQAVIQRLTLMGDYLEKYWEGIGRTMSQLVTAEEIIIGKDHIAVVESDAASITVHVEGKNYTYKVAQLPRKLMNFMVERFLTKEPAAKVYYGVYLTISPNGDRNRARALLEEAAKQDSDVEKLLPELDEAPVPGGEAAAANKSAPPQKAKLDEILQTIHDKYKTDYDQASTPRGKGALAKILLDNGRSTLDDMDQRYGMLDAARQEAIAAGDAALACQVVDEMGKLHAMEVFHEKVATLEELGEAAHGLASHREIAETALAMAGTAMEANRLEEASRLAKLAMSAASKAKNVPMTKQARSLYLQIENLRKQK